jgi:hypothetical protein
MKELLTRHERRRRRRLRIRRQEYQRNAGDDQDFIYWCTSGLFKILVDTSMLIGGQLQNRCYDNTIDYITVTGLIGNATYALPNNATYIADDTDYCWFKIDGSVSTMTSARMVGYDFARTIIKYDDVSPYTERWIGVLKATANPTTAQMDKMRDNFHLSMWWSNVLSSHGAIKQNKPLPQQYIWFPEVNLPTGLTLTLISGGVNVVWTDTNGGLAQTEIWAQNDGGISALLTTIAAGTNSYNDICNPVDHRYYKIRALENGIYSSFTTELNIVMLGSEMVTDGGFNIPADWTIGGNDTISGGVANMINTASGYIYQTGNLVSGNKYRLKFDIGGRTVPILFTPFNVAFGFGMNDYANGSYTLYQLCTSTYGYYNFVNSSSGGSFTLDNVSCKQILMP